MRALVALLAGFALLTTSASAQLVSRSEDGTVDYLLAAPIGADAPVDLRPGDVAWRERLRPAQLVRLTSSGVERMRPGRTPGLMSGEILFAYRLSSGFAYCPTRALGPGSSRVQCYRDFDADGDFDGAYVTISRGIESMILPGGLRGLVPMPPVTYEAVDVSEAPEVEAAVIYTGWRNGAPRFRLRVEDEWLRDEEVCAPAGEGACTVNAILLRATPLDRGGARIEILESAPQRGLRICFETEAPGNPCRDS